MRSKAPEA